MSCATNDLVETQEELSNQNLLKLSNRGLLSKTTNEIVVMNLDINRGLFQSQDGGCSSASQRAFGPNPTNFYNYTIRGYGQPRTDLSYKGIQLRTGNRPTNVVTFGQNYLIDNVYESAISIEFPFLANVTYEINLQTIVEDFIYKEQHDRYDQNDDYHGLQQSQAFPTVAVELKDTPQISGNNPCGGRPAIGNMFIQRNYFKKQKAEITVPPSYEQKTFTYNFSTTENKNALIIYFLPERSGMQPNYVPESSFNLNITNIKITQKPYNPAFYVPAPTNPNPCGWFRGC